MIFRAIQFVAEAHEGHYRKGTNIPYITHLMGVMKILCKNQCSTEVIVAGILHDVIEDTPVTIDVVERKFGKRIAEIVAGASELAKLNKSNTATWKARKELTIKHLQTTSDIDQLLVSCADKLDNARAILEDFLDLGDALWTRFNASKEEQKWYYQSLTKVFLERAKEFGNPLSKMANQLNETVKQIFEQ